MAKKLALRVRFDKSSSWKPNLQRSMYYRPRLANGELVQLSWPLVLLRWLNHIYWPLEDGVSIWLRLLDRFGWLFSFLIFVQHNEAEFRYIYLNVQNIDELLTGVPTYLVLVETQLRCFLVSWNKEGFKRLLQWFYTKIYLEKSSAPCQFRRIQRQLRPNKVYCVLYCSALASFFAIPIVNLIKQRKDTMYKMSFSYDYTPNYIFIPLTMSSMYVGCIVVTIVFGELTMASEILLHLNERYLLLRQDLQAATERRLKTSVASDIAKNFQCEVLHIIQRNAQLNAFAAEFQRIYSFRIFVLFAFSAGLICALSFKVYTNPAESIGYVVWMLGKVLEMVAFGEVGSSLIATTDKISYMYYESCWEKVILRSTDTRENVRLMKLILVAIELNQKPYYLMGLNFFGVSLTAVVKILQGAASYFTCLIALR